MKAIASVWVLIASTVLAGGLIGAEMALANEAGRTAHFSLPIVSLGRGLTAHAELNLGMKAGVALEANFQSPGEYLSDEEVDDTGHSLMAGGRGFSILFSRYSDPMYMGGWYYGVGIGHRTMEADYVTSPDDTDTQVDWSLVDADGRTRFQAKMTGVTGHARAGYRYVGKEWPLLVGAYFGFRHFQMGISDTEFGASEDSPAVDSQSPLTDREVERLRRLFTTSVESGLEIGFAF